MNEEKNLTKELMKLQEEIKVLQEREEFLKNILKQQYEIAGSCPSWMGRTYRMTVTARVSFSGEGKKKKDNENKFLNFIAENNLEVYLKPDLTGFSKDERVSTEKGFVFFEGKPVLEVENKEVLTLRLVNDEQTEKLKNMEEIK